MVQKGEIRLLLILAGIAVSLSLNGSAVTRQLCPMLETNADRDFQLELEDLEIILRCQENFPIELSGFGEVQVKPDIIDEYHQIDLDDEKHERKLELVFKPEFPDCPGWVFSLRQERRRYPLKEESDRNRWWISLSQDCIPILPNYFRHEQQKFPHDPEDDRIEDELSFEAEAAVDGGTTLNREFFAERRRFPNDPEDNRLRLVSEAQLEQPFCSDNVTADILLEKRQYPNDRERNRWAVKSSIAPTCDFDPLTLKSKAQFELRRYPNYPKGDWKIRKFLLEADKELGGATLNARAYWQHYRRPNNPGSSTNRDQFWLRFIGEKTYEDMEVEITAEWRWRDVPVKPENDRCIRILEVELVWELEPVVDLLFDFRLEDKEYPNDPEDDELDSRILAGLKLSL